MRTFNEAKERAAQDGTEYRWGAVQTDLALIPKDLRLLFLPDGVLQYNNIMDSNGCASRAPLNILEAKLTYAYKHKTLMPNSLKTWLRANGYIVDGKVVLNDAFIEILSGTDKNGNSLKAPVDTIYRYGVIPAHLLPLEEGMTWEQYMDPKRVTQDMRDLGKQFLLRFGINYEKVPRETFPEALETDFLSVALFAWPEPVNGVYPATSGSFNHAVAAVDNYIYVEDNYEPFLKLLAKNYPMFDWGYSLSIVRMTPDPQQELSFLASMLQKALEILKKIGTLKGYVALKPAV